MLVPLSWLRELIDVDIPTPELAERLSLAGMEVEGIEQAGGDEVLNIAITPDAARCLSVIGVAREVAAILEKPLKLPADEFSVSGDDRAGPLARVSIEDANLCQRYIAVIVKDVTIKESPQWMKDRLERAGVRPVNNIVDITNYVMLECGQPLHAFDFAMLKLRAGSDTPHVIVRPAKAGEKMKTLDAADRNLDPTMLMICDARGPIAVAGVMGGADSEVSLSTKEILLEAATFDKTSVRRTAQKLKMSTEASFRFTRGIPSRLPEIAARRAAKLMVDLAGGRIVPGMVDQYPSPQQQVFVYLTASQVRRTLGIQVSIEEISKELARLEFVSEKLGAIPQDAGEGATALHVEPGEAVLKCAVPWYRLDVRIPADLTEEIARLRGFDSIPMTQLSEPLPRPTHNLISETEEAIRDILIGCGLSETINYSLTTSQQHEKLGLITAAQSEAPGRVPPDADKKGSGVISKNKDSRPLFVTLANAMSVDRTVMRRSLLVSAIENLAHNIRFTPRLATFEVGRAYFPEQSDDGIRPLEDRRVSLLLAGPRREVNINSDPDGAEAMDFFDLKGVIETLLSRLGIAAVKVRFVPHRADQTFTPRCAKVMIGETDAGVFGELNPAALSQFGIKIPRVAAAELRLAPLIRGEWDWSRVTTVNHYPAVIEDLAFVVDESVGAGTVSETLRKSGAGKVVDIELFDVFRGAALGAGKKSLAYRVTYQAPDAALTNEQVVSIRNGVVQSVAAEHGGVLRTQ